MNDDVPRSIRFPKKLWAAIDEDAQRCKRSSVRQMEAVLATYYEIEDVEINKVSLEMIGELLPRSAKKMPLLEAKVEEPMKKKKKA